MPKFEKFKLDSNDKLSMLGVTPVGAKSDAAVILKVSKPGYVPPGFTVRSRIDEILFTAIGNAAAIEAARHDAAVESISPATTLRQIG